MELDHKMNGVKQPPTVADLANMTTEERMSGMEHSEVRYFTSYDHHGIHEEMLKDEVRHTIVQRCNLPEQAHLQGQGGFGCRLRYRHSQHVGNLSHTIGLHSHNTGSQRVLARST